MSSAARDPGWVYVSRLDEVIPGKCRIVQVGSKSIGLFNVKGQVIAVLNVCPHELAPICRGRIGGTTLPSAPGQFVWGREGEILACPWHGWEFDLLTGLALVDEQVKLHRFPVHVEEEKVFISFQRSVSERSEEF